MELIQPPPALRRDIECFRVATHDTREDVSIHVCPNTFPGLVFQQHENQSAISDIVVASGRVVHVPTLFLHGQVTELSVMHLKGPYNTIQAILKPHALRPLFGIDASMITNSSMAPDSFGGKVVNEELLAATDTNRRIILLIKFLEAKLQANGQRDNHIEEILTFINDGIRSMTVEKVCKNFGMSERQLQRKFKQNVGISPQLYIRIRRVNEAFHLMDSGEFEHLSDIAYELNFHDQSHFIRDIKTFSGITPKSISQKVNEFYHDQVGSSYVYR